jgi:hypothetical protein
MSRVLPVMWASLNCGRPVHAVWRTSGFSTWSWIWILFNLQHLGRRFQQFPSGSLGEMMLASFLVFIWLLVWLSRRSFTWVVHAGQLKSVPQAGVLVDGSTAMCQSRLIGEFREIVREPLPDPSDPRFKKWNVRERFPWGWGLVQQQLHERLARR